MRDKPKFILAFTEGLPDKEAEFVRRILEDFRDIGVKCIAVETLSDISRQLIKQEGIVFAFANSSSESLLAPGLTTVVYDKNLGSGLPYGFDLIVDSFEDIDIDFLIRLFKHKNKIPCMIAETKRTIIRELCAQDIDEVIKISREEHILKFVEDGRVPEEEQKEKLLAYIDNIYSFYDYGIWGIFDRADGSLIGLISLDLLTDTEEAEYETGFFIRKERLGQGFAKEAIEMVIDYAGNKLSASKLIAVTDCENVPARSLLEKCGFTEACSNDKMIYVKQLENKESDYGITKGCSHALKLCKHQA